jgi:RsiW-degrading membrane proteinase PrsW (M82 family)
MSKRQKRLVLGWGLLWLVGGLIAGVAFLITAAIDGAEWRVGLSRMVPLMAGLGGGGLVTFFAARSMTQRPTWAFRLPPAWALGGGFVLALAVGLGLWQTWISTAFLMPLFAVAAAALGPLAVIGWIVGRQPGGVSARRGWTALGLGATASTSLAYVLNTLLPGAVLFLVFGLADTLLPLAEELLDALQWGPVTEDMLSPWFLVALVEIAVIVPVVEELVKPLALLPLLKKVQSPRDAFLLGALAGAGFAAVENVLYAALVGSAWGGVLAVRAVGAALHPLGAGLMALAWWGVLRRQPGASGRWARNYGLAVSAHALWNGTCVVAATVGYVWFQGWEVDLLGVSDGAVLVALLAAQGIGLLVALRALVQRLAPEREDAEAILQTPALPTERALAVWGVLCLVILLPVALGVLRIVW